MPLTMPKHVRDLQDYLLQASERNEDLAISYFRQLYGNCFKRQSDASNADGYVAGHFLLELKGQSRDWYAALYQGLAYERSNLDFSTVVVCAKGFLAAWRKEDISEDARNEILAEIGAASSVGRKYAKKYEKRKSALLRKAYWYHPELSGDLFLRNDDAFERTIRSFETALRAQKRVRQAITLKNFLKKLDDMKQFFPPQSPIRAVRAFYTMIYGPWDNSSTLIPNQRKDDRATLGGVEVTDIVANKRSGFKTFVENHEIKLSQNENVDDFFTRYDEALDTVDRNFRVKNGIFFTDLNLSKLAMWMVKQKIPNLGRNYLVIDPACGSGNLVTNWRSPLELRHKVVSEIEPELLYAVEQRMRGDQWHHGKFTVVPKTTENIGLNFLDKPAATYLSILRGYLEEKGQKPDKPIAFLCNPPYRSDDDQAATAIGYKIDPAIVDLVGVDAAAERYCCFLGQMKLICDAAADCGIPDESVLLLFTKSSWLTKRPVFQSVRRQILGAFQDLGGVLVNGREFFDLKGSFPVDFTMWKYCGADSGLDPDREVQLTDLTWVKREQLRQIDWVDAGAANRECEAIVKSDRSVPVALGVERENIRTGFGLRMIADFKRNRRRGEPAGAAVGGLPRGDHRTANKKAYGEALGKWVGFMDDLTPCRIGKPTVEAPYFYLESRFMRVRSFRCFSGPADKYCYVASSIELAEKLFPWFALGRTFSACGYPMWADALELWAPIAKGRRKELMLRFSYAIAFAENECVDTRVPANNPIRGAIEVTVKNPMSPLDATSFWSRNFREIFAHKDSDTPAKLVHAVEAVFAAWKSVFKTRRSLLPLTPHTYFVGDGEFLLGAGLVQIRDYAAENDVSLLLEKLDVVQALLKATREEFLQFLTSTTGLDYFGKPVSVGQGSTAFFKPKTKFDHVVEKRLALAVTLVGNSFDDPKFGLTKFVKLFYLADNMQRLDLRTEYSRHAAGPLDARALYNERIGLIPLSTRHGYFEARKQAGTTTFFRRENTAGALRAADRLLGNTRDAIVALVKTFRDLDTDQSEIVATLYACWNDLLLEEKQITDDLIVREFLRNWHPKKARFSKPRLTKALGWMRSQGIVPMGYGMHTSIREADLEGVGRLAIS